MTLAITKPGDDIGEDLLPEFRSLIGPLDVNTAKEEAPSRWINNKMKFTALFNNPLTLNMINCYNVL